jgi:uncharacterized phage-associated protein
MFYENLGSCFKMSGKHRGSIMSNHELKFDFNRQKTIEAILYIAQKVKDADYHSISKLLYFADKTHLERYGRFITGDTYYAMQYGPVPSNTYNLMKEGSAFGNSDFRVEDGKRVVALRLPKMDEFSRSDVKMLDLAIDLYGEMPFWMKTSLSHDAAWESAWNARGGSQTAPMSIESIVALLEKPELLLEFLRDPFPGEA